MVIVVHWYASIRSRYAELYVNPLIYFVKKKEIQNTRVVMSGCKLKAYSPAIPVKIIFYIFVKTPLKIHSFILDCALLHHVS